MNSMICPYCGNLIAYNSYFDAFYCSKCGGFFKQATVMECNDLNEPLTLDELRKMDGEPVWVEFQDGSGGCWGLVHITMFNHVVFTHVVFTNGLYCTVGKPYFGKTWLAYRQEKEV